MTTLIGMTEKIIQQFDLLYAAKISEHEYITSTKKYANFLKQPLELGFFVPVDLDGNVLESCTEICACECDKIKAYRAATDRVIFAGFEIQDWDLCGKVLVCDDIIDPIYIFNQNRWNYRSVESLVKYNPPLTDKAIELLNK